jgi:hypothetical protein
MSLNLKSFTYGSGFQPRELIALKNKSWLEAAPTEYKSILKLMPLG